MIKRVSFVIVAIAFVCILSSKVFSQQQDSVKAGLVLREGKQVRNDTVAVEVYVVDGILEVRVEVRMYSERPKIKNVMLVGPRVGRLSYDLKEEIPLILEEEDPYLIRSEGGVISRGEKKKYKKPKGTLTKELFKIKVPWEKIVPDKRYQLWVDVESKTRGGERPKKFRFNLEKFSQYGPK